MSDHHFDLPLIDLSGPFSWIESIVALLLFPIALLCVPFLILSLPLGFLIYNVGLNYYDDGSLDSRGDHIAFWGIVCMALPILPSLLCILIWSKTADGK